MSAVSVSDCRGLRGTRHLGGVQCNVCHGSFLSVTTGHILNFVLSPDHKTDCNTSECTDLEELPNVVRTPTLPASCQVSPTSASLEDPGPSISVSAILVGSLDQSRIKRLLCLPFSLFPEGWIFKGAA